MMRRRQFIAITGAVALGPSRAAFAQAIRRPLIGVLGGASEATSQRYLGGFDDGMRELGHVDGQNVDIVRRFADGDLSRLPVLARELVDLSPRVILAGNSSGALAVRAATQSIPVVVAALADPVGQGLAASNARPGGNVTGLLNYVSSLPGKQLELVLQTVPSATTCGLLLNAAGANAAVIRPDANAAAASLGMKLLAAEVRAADQIDSAFQSFARGQAQAALVTADPLFLDERRRIAGMAAAAKLPAIYPYREHVEDGGLMSYGINVRESFRQCAGLVDKVLKGANPAEMPLALANTFELVLNRKTASALGITFPRSVLSLADEVIE